MTDRPASAHAKKLLPDPVDPVITIFSLRSIKVPSESREHLFKRNASFCIADDRFWECVIPEPASFDIFLGSGMITVFEFKARAQARSDYCGPCVGPAGGSAADTVLPATALSCLKERST